MHKLGNKRCSEHVLSEQWRLAISDREACDAAAFDRMNQDHIRHSATFDGRRLTEAE